MMQNDALLFKTSILSTGCANKKQSLGIKCCNSVMVARILAKLSAFVQEYSRNICCEFYSNNCDGSTDTAVLTLNFNFSSEHAVAH